MNIKKHLKNIKKTVNDNNDYNLIDVEKTNNNHLKIICERDGLKFYTIIPSTPSNGFAEKGVMKMINIAFVARKQQLENRK